MKKQQEERVSGAMTNPLVRTKEAGATPRLSQSRIFVTVTPRRPFR